MSIRAHGFDHNNKHGEGKCIQTEVVVCPNDECREITVKAYFGDVSYPGGIAQFEAPIYKQWTLMPSNSAMVFPEYVPLAIRQDYEEACAIRDLSPKASATLSRRCLQGLIRDYWKIAKARLVDEINALEEKVDPDTWAAIDAVRRIGNIGAHMEKDINVIIDVDASEAQLLIELIESLIKDWYIARHKRQAHLANIVAAASAKK
ncbi:DUF4145 domain-containing protein [Enterobacterales bacterium AW_CKDN230030176-1A_HGKHYDSX7]